MSRYQDYVIKDGKFIGNFEEMYQKFDDPWNQSKNEIMKTDKLIMLNLLKKYKLNSVVEFGCGLGYFSNAIFLSGIDITGVDISHTAICKAKSQFPNINFIVGDVINFDIIDKIHPMCIIMSEITWYILDKLKIFLDNYRRFNNIYLLHSLTFYAPGIQKYGNNFFTTHDQLLNFFNLKYIESGICIECDTNSYRSYFLALP